MMWMGQQAIIIMQLTFPSQGFKVQSAWWDLDDGMLGLQIPSFIGCKNLEQPSNVGRKFEPGEAARRDSLACAWQARNRCFLPCVKRLGRHFHIKGCRKTNCASGWHRIPKSFYLKAACIVQSLCWTLKDLHGCVSCALITSTYLPHIESFNTVHCLQQSEKMS